MIGYGFNDNAEALKRVIEIDERIQEEGSKEQVDGSLMTKLMFEQMLRGLHVTDWTMI